MTYYLTMIMVNIHEAKAHLSELLERALNGEQVVLCKRNVPLIELTPVKTERPKPFIGGCPYKIEVLDSFFEPMDDEFMRHFDPDAPLLITDPLHPDYVPPKGT